MESFKTGQFSTIRTGPDRGTCFAQSPVEVSAMLRLRLLGIGLAAVFAVGCATMNVSSHVERGIDFAQFATYDWGPADALPTGDPRLDNNPFFKDYLTGAVDRQLAARGYRLATDKPQLLIHFHANVSQRFEVHGVDRSTYVNCYPNCEPEVVDYEQGTIVLDFMDAASDRMVWRGWAQDNIAGIIDDQDRLKAHIEKAVTRMFEQFPRRETANAR
jgi:hypothetical protein